MNYLTRYYKNLCEQLQEQINQLEANLEEGTMSKAMRKGKKYPGTIVRAAHAQTRRLRGKQRERDSLKGGAETEAALEYRDVALGKPYASGMDAENWWREARGESTSNTDRERKKEKGKKRPNEVFMGDTVNTAQQRVDDVIGNLAKLGIGKFFSFRKK